MKPRRKRKPPTGDREPNGRKRRGKSAKPSEDVRTTAVQARQRVYGLTPEQADHEKASTVLGRLWLNQQLTERQRMAGEKYRELYDAHIRATQAPDSLAVSGRLGSGGDQISDEYIEWAVKAEAAYDVHRLALIDNSTEQTVRRVVIEDLEPMEHAERVMLRVGLDRLAVRLSTGSGEG